MFTRTSFRHRLFLAISIVLTLLIGITAVTATKNTTDIVYNLSWDTSGVTFHQDDKGWQITNNLGYTIFVHQGYVSTASVELVPCASDTTADSGNLLESWLVPQVAYAGHSAIEPDPSRLSGPYIESLTEFESAEFGVATTDHHNYCQTHYLVAQANETAVNLPSDVDMTSLTLFIEGEYMAPNSNEAVPFSIDTLLAWGAYSDLADAGETADLTAGNSVQITFQRELASLFDNVGFSEMSTQDQAMGILRSLTENTTISVNNRS